MKFLAREAFLKVRYHPYHVLFRRLKLQFCSTFADVGVAPDQPQYRALIQKLCDGITPLNATKSEPWY